MGYTLIHLLSGVRVFKWGVGWISKHDDARRKQYGPQVRVLVHMPLLPASVRSICVNAPIMFMVIMVIVSARSRLKLKL